MRVVPALRRRSPGSRREPRTGQQAGVETGGVDRAAEGVPRAVPALDRWRPARADTRSADAGSPGLRADLRRRPHVNTQGPGLTVGIDIGGTSIRAAAVDRDGDVVDSVRTQTPSSAVALENALHRLVEHLRERNDIAAVGLG